MHLEFRVNISIFTSKVVTFHISWLWSNSCTLCIYHRRLKGDPRKQLFFKEESCREAAQLLCNFSISHGSCFKFWISILSLSDRHFSNFRFNFTLKGYPNVNNCLIAVCDTIIFSFLIFSIFVPPKIQGFVIFFKIYIYRSLRSSNG